MTRARFLALPLALLAAPAFAEPPTRESTMIVYGDDACPRASDPDEVVVCARRPEAERYRIPRSIRERQQTEVAWAARVEGLDEASRPMRPGSCSAVGTLGQTGCAQALIRQWYADRRARREADGGVP